MLAIFNHIRYDTIRCAETLRFHTTVVYQNYFFNFYVSTVKFPNKIG